jgi:hypothetical protein
VSGVASALARANVLLLNRISQRAEWLWGDGRRKHIAKQKQRLGKARYRNHVTRAFARYWRRKRIDPTFHTGTLGGARHCLWSQQMDNTLQAVLWQELRANPLRNRNQLTDELVLITCSTR